MENKHNVYDDEFYKDRNRKTQYSAKIILSMVFAKYKILSAVDFGCGVGTWLNESRKLGAKIVKGLDGDYVNRNYLKIGSQEFVATDLSQRVKLDKKYDLAISLEVAEHLPRKRAKSFVDDLCNASDVILFSAATKGQGGDEHINEQRLSYWVNLFDKRGYEVIDMIRPKVWNDVRIPVWYRENIVVFVNRDNVEVSREDRADSPKIYDMIHPELYEAKVAELEALKNKKIVKICSNLENLINNRK